MEPRFGIDVSLDDHGITVTVNNAAGEKIALLCVEDVGRNDDLSGRPGTEYVVQTAVRDAARTVRSRPVGQEGDPQMFGGRTMKAWVPRG